MTEISNVSFLGIISDCMLSFGDSDLCTFYETETELTPSNHYVIYVCQSFAISVIPVYLGAEGHSPVV